MAETLEAGAALSALFTVLLERVTSREVVDFFGRGGQLSGVLLQNLAATLKTLNGVLDDAERKQFTSPAVKKWLDDLKDVAYEADDFVDDIAYKLEVREVPKSLSDQVRNLLIPPVNPFRKDILKARLKEILGRLEFLLRQKDPLGLVEAAGVGASSQSISSSTRPTTSLLDVFTIFGRGGDKEAIVRLVLSEDANGQNLGVVPIIGMGGIGKTTLAQLVYNDSSVNQRFEIKAWVCISEESDIYMLTNYILKEIGVSDCDSSTLNQLQTKLEEKVRGVRVFLVLDDIWNEHADWTRLLAPFSSAAHGSKVLITTRNQQVALALSSVPCYWLDVLDEGYCWSLFAKHAFNDCYPFPPDLVEIGRRIVRKCRGLPLSIELLGSLLRSKRDTREWEKILVSLDLLYDNFIPAVAVSYHYLPPHLKQCFAYCAMFPSSIAFRKDYLVLLCMTDGFVPHANQVRHMEATGAEYFEDLVSRSLFKKVGGIEHSDSFVMHDLIHDFARSIAGEFCFNGEEDVNLGGPTERTRHLYLTSNQGATLVQFMSRGKVDVWRSLICSITDADATRHLEDNISRLRQLRLLQLSGSSLKRLPKGVTTLCKLQTLVVEDCEELTKLPNSIGNLSRLRHLSLKKTSLRKLPDSIGKLKALRHLDVGYTAIERLPESICGLYKLQTLNLRGCRKLVELPDKITDLTNLCSLDITRTRMQYMPVKMSKLTRFVVDKQPKDRRFGEL